MTFDTRALISSILHTTDFSNASDIAFDHALALSVSSGSSLSILHIEKQTFSGSDWNSFPHVRAKLIKWGIIDYNINSEELLSETGIKIQKIEITNRSAVSSIVDYVNKHPVDLIVLATHGRNGLPGWLRGSVSEPVLRQCKKKAIFIPELVRGFINSEGKINLENIIIPVDFKPNPLPAIRYTVDFVKIYSISEKINIFIFHVGDSIKLDKVEMYSDERINIFKEIVSGNVIEEILKKSKQTNADLMVMPTCGHNGILDILRGGTTERLLHLIDCPVLVYP